MRETWARTRVQVQVGHRDMFPPEPILHVAARYCSYRAAHALLSAGANELSCNAQGKRASDVIGDFEEDREGKEAADTALRRLLKHGSAVRARFWTWPNQAEAAVGIAAEATCPTVRSVRVPAFGVQTFRRNDRSVLHRVCWCVSACDLLRNYFSFKYSVAKY